jgi:hypothetical protein
MSKALTAMNLRRIALFAGWLFDTIEDGHDD